MHLRTVFLGGGTPTTLGSEHIERLLAEVGAATSGGAVEEFTVEANPATIDDAKAGVLIDGGVTRLSLGAQSFRAEELALLGRLHAPGDVAQSIATIRQAGLVNFNLDLIFGIPGQTPASWRESLREALDLEPTHVACYGLTYEAGTPLRIRLERGEVVACAESLEAEMYETAVDVLQEAGFEHYEISNFALAGHRCAHNLVYWRNEPYLAVGPSAAGFVAGRRYRNVADNDEYVRRINETGSAVVEEESVTGLAAVLEVLMMRLRLREGLDLAWFHSRMGVDLARLCAGTLSRLRNEGLLEIAVNHLRLTRRGLLVADAIIAELAAALEDGPNKSLPVVQSKDNPQEP